MSLTTAILDTIKAVLDQLTSRQLGRSAHPRTISGISFTKNFYAKAKAAGLTEQDASDVYYSGYISQHKQNMMLKDYNGYQLGIYYFLSPKTGKPVISTIWKREH